MGFLRFLGLTSSKEETLAGEYDVESIRRISKELDQMEPERARYLSAFAYLLGRVAHADLNISDEEGTEMERIVMERGMLPEEQAVMTVEIAKRQNRLFGHIENFLVSRVFNEIASETQKMELLDCLFAVCAADQSVSAVEEREIRLIAGELLLGHKDYIRIRSRYRDYLEVLKRSTDEG